LRTRRLFFRVLRGIKLLISSTVIKAFDRRVRRGTAAKVAEKTKIYGEGCIGSFTLFRYLEFVLLCGLGGFSFAFCGIKLLISSTVIKAFDRGVRRGTGAKVAEKTKIYGEGWIGRFALFRYNLWFHCVCPELIPESATSPVARSHSRPLEA
jgi:hypothetical protein